MYIKLFFLIYFLLLNNCSSSEKKQMEREIYATNTSSSLAGGVDGVSSQSASKELEPDSKRGQKRMMIYNANVRIKTESVQKTIEEIQIQTEKMEGIVLQMNSYGSLTVKVPSDKLKKFLSNLKNSSKEYSEEIFSKDVTEEYQDIEIQLENAKKSRQRYLELLKVAKNVEEVLKVQAELNKATETIDTLEGRIRYLKDKTDYSTITIHIYSDNRAIVVKEKEYEPGILGYPFYYLYKGTGYVFRGIVWLFVREKADNGN
jgi:hypothetical protein